MRVLITGAAGFIGSHLAEQFDDVVGIDDLSTGRRANFRGDLIVADIVDGIPDVPADVIFHCAASYRDRAAWERDARTNVLGTLNVIRHAQRVDAKIVYFQTSLCYGPRPRVPCQVGDPLAPEGSYAVSKTAGEQYIRDAGLPFVSLRLANVFGPRNLSGPVPTFYKRLSAGEPCTVVDARRDFVFIDDLVRVAARCATEGRGVYHVSTGVDAPIAAVYAAVRAALELPPEEPALIERGPDDAATILVDPSQTEAAFRWRAETSLEDGIRRAVAWYVEHGVTETYTHLSVKG